MKTDSTRPEVLKASECQGLEKRSSFQCSQILTLVPTQKYIPSTIRKEWLLCRFRYTFGAEAAIDTGWIQDISIAPHYHWGIFHVVKRKSSLLRFWSMLWKDLWASITSLSHLLPNETVNGMSSIKWVNCIPLVYIGTPNMGIKREISVENKDICFIGDTQVWPTDA